MAKRKPLDPHEARAKASLDRCRDDVRKCTRCYDIHPELICPLCGNPEFALIRKDDRSVPGTQGKLFT